MEFLVEFERDVPGGTPESEVRDRQDAEATVAAQLDVPRASRARTWKLTVAPGEAKVLGLYEADSRAPPGVRDLQNGWMVAGATT